MSNHRHEENATGLRWLLRSSVYETFTLLVIGINCIAITLYDPLVTEDKQAPYLGLLNWVFNLIYVGDMFTQLCVYGAKEYLSNQWHYLDLLVGSVSLLEMSLVFIGAIGLALGIGKLNLGASFDKALNILQILRVLRPLKAFNFLPSLMAYLYACAKSFKDLLVIILFLGFALATLSIFCSYSLGNMLQFRCVPSDISDPNVIKDVYYQDYGTDIFYTKYNLQFCSSIAKQCLSGFSCVNINLPFDGVSADFETPWRSFITNLSFLTLRGWPNIFWATLDVGGTGRAAAVLVSMFFMGYVMIVNLFPAIFIGNLRAEEERMKKLEWLSFYPGNLDTISELELLVWVSENKRNLDKSINSDLDVPIPTRIFRALWKAINPKAYDKAMLKLNKDREAAIEDDEDALNPEKNVGKIPWRPFVIRSRSWDILRSYIIPDTSVFNFFVIGLVCFNIVLLSMDSSNPSYVVTEFQFWGDIVCNTVFAVELVAKLLLLGPVVYCDSVFNILDMFLVVLGLAKYFADVPSFVTNLRVIKLLRLLRLYRVAKLVDLNKDTKSFKDATISIGNLAGLVVDMSGAMLNTMIVSLLLLYILALVGMKFFVNGDECYSKGLTIGCGLEPLDPSSPAVIPFDLETSWGGAYTARMNYDSFLNAFATVFNIMFLNNWYNVMVKSILQYGSTWNAWFYMTCVFMLNYFSTATLISSSTNVLELHAEQQLIDEAQANRRYLDRIVYIRTKLYIQAFMKRWKKNTLDSDDAQKNVNLSVTSAATGLANVRLDVKEKPPSTTWLQRFLTARSKHSFYFFQVVAKNEDGSIRQGYIRYYLDKVVKSVLFNGFMWVATMMVVALALASEEDADTPFFLISNYYCFVMFLGEMFMKMIIQGCFDYFCNIMNVFDFANNTVMVISVLEPGLKIFTQFRIIRLIKFPDILRSFSQSHSLAMVIETLYSAPNSIMNLIFVCGILVYFFAVIGLQTWLDCFGYCSYDAYPEFQGKNEASPEFPEGCKGMYNVPNVFGATSYIPISWNTHANNFDNIFSSFASCFRVFTGNDWQGLLYTSFDVTGEGLQGKEGNNRLALLFYLFLAYLALTVSVMFLGILYYHFIMTTLRFGRKLTTGTSNAMWQIMEERLMNVNMLDGNIWDRNQPNKLHHSRHLLWRIFRSQIYNYLVTAFCVMPLLLLLGNYEATYRKSSFIYIDLSFSISYLGEYCLRVWVLRVNAINRAVGKQEVFVNGLLIVFVIFLITQWTTYDHETTAFSRLCVNMCIVLRCFRLFYTSASFNAITKTLKKAMTGIIPTFGYYVTLVLIYAVMGVMAMSDLDTNYDSEYLNERFNFKTYLNAIITLMSIGTGNMYTEILEKLKENAEPGLNIFIEFYFFTFYIFSTVIMKSFALMIISKFLSYSGGSLGLASQQVQQFKNAWRVINYDGNDISMIKLKELVVKLPAPLGLAGRTNKFVEIEMFLRQLLVVMPSAALHLNDFDAKSQRQLYTGSTLPTNIWNKDLPRMTFKQCIISLHKNVLQPVKIERDVDDEKNRFKAREWSYLLRQKFSRSLVQDSIPDEQKGQEESHKLISYRSLLITQRMEPQAYREQFVQITSQRLDVIQNIISSLGFGPYAGWVLSKLRDTLRVEEHSARLRHEVAKRVSAGMFNQELGKLKRHISHTYHAQVCNILRNCNKLYTTYVRQIWEASSIAVVQSFQHCKSVSAIDVDDISNVYVAIGKSIQIYKNYTSNPEVKESSRYRALPPLNVEENIHSLVVSSNGKKLYVGVGCDIQCYSLVNSRSSKAAHFKREDKILSYHTDNVSVLARETVSESRYLASGSVDGSIVLWELFKSRACLYYETRLPIFALSVILIQPPRGVPIEEAPLQQVVVAGCKDGSVYVLSVPLHASAQDQVSRDWDPIILRTESSVPISSITMAWNFLYVGGADGSVRVWSITTNSGTSTTFNFKSYLNFANVDCKYLHTGAVTGLLFAGETLLSCSHDFSFIPFTEPENLKAKTPSAFKQDVGAGLVLHNDQITCMRSNKFILVSGNNSGGVKICTPKVIREGMIREELKNVKSSVKFSFHQFNFDMAWCSHQNVSPESECYLNICNNGNETVRIRCLHNLAVNPNFKVEIANVEIKAGIMQMPGQKQKKYYNVGPKERIVFRIMFIPTEELSYTCNIGFLINELESVNIRFRGTGVRPRIAVKNHMELFDFGLVHVGSSRLVTIDVTNQTAKDIVSSFVENTRITFDPDTHTEETWSLSKRNVTVTPRIFHLEAHQTIRLFVRFTPKDVFSTFEESLTFSVAGAQYALTKVRMRSAISHEVVKDLLPKLKNDNNSHKNLNIVDAERDKKASRHIATNLEEVESFREQPQHLRNLHSGENLCRADLIPSFLHNVAWKTVIDKDLAIFVHKTTGVFLEIPEYSEHQLTKNCDAIDTIKLELTNGVESIYYEVWHSKNLLAKGFAEPNEKIAVFINSEQLKAETAWNVDGNMEECKVDSTGRIALQFQIFSKGTVERNPLGQVPRKVFGVSKVLEERVKFGSLISTMTIQVYKGFRIVRTGAGKDFAFLDRLVVSGIERIVSYSSSGMVLMDEKFGDELDSRGQLLDKGSPAFAPILLTIDSTSTDDVITHFRVSNTITQVIEEKLSDEVNSLSTEEKCSRTKSTFTHAIHSTTGIETVKIPRTILNMKHQSSQDDSSYGLTRTIEVVTERSHNVRGKLQNKVIGEVDYLSAHTGSGLINRARATHVSPRSLFPCDVVSDRYSFVISVVEPSDALNGQSFDGDGRRIEANEIYNTLRVASALDRIMIGDKFSMGNEIKSNQLFMTQWFFVHDCHELRLVSSEAPPLGEFHINVGLLEDSFAGNAASHSTKVSTKACTDIRFTCHGFHALLEDRTMLHCGNGFIVPIYTISKDPSVTATNNASTLNGKFFRTVCRDFDGKEDTPKEASPYMLSLWEIKKKNDILTAVKGAFARLLQKRVQIDLAQKQAEAADLVSAFERKLELELSRSGIKELNSSQTKERMKVLSQAEILRSSVAVSSSPAAIFGEIFDIISVFETEYDMNTGTKLPPNVYSSADNEAKLPKKASRIQARLMFSSFVLYLRTIKLPGFESVMSKSEVNCAIRSLDNELVPGVGNVVTRDAFTKWYTMRDATEATEALTAKTLFPLLLEEQLADRYHSSSANGEFGEIIMLAENATSNLSSKVREGSDRVLAAKRMSIMWDSLRKSRGMTKARNSISAQNNALLSLLEFGSHRLSFSGNVDPLLLEGIEPGIPMQNLSQSAGSAEDAGVVNNSNVAYVGVNLDDSEYSDNGNSDSEDTDNADKYEELADEKDEEQE